jgi:hypothetical protein
MIMQVLLGLAIISTIVAFITDRVVGMMTANNNVRCTVDVIVPAAMLFLIVARLAGGGAVELHIGSLGVAVFAVAFGGLAASLAALTAYFFVYHGLQR